jgi:hypothetical protein
VVGRAPRRRSRTVGGPGRARGPLRSFHAEVSVSSPGVHLCFTRLPYRQARMKTVTTPSDDRALPAHRQTNVDAFFDSLRQEQAKFLASMRQASSLLSGDPGQLAFVAAEQGRLTRQFFDAQRSIMMRRAEYDSDVAMIVRIAEEEAASIVAAARVRAQASGSRSVLGELDVAPATGSPRAELTVGPPATSQDVAALGVAVVRTTQDATSLAAVIDAGLERVERDGSTAQRQLATVLDQWWAAENEEGLQMVEAAQARATVHRHFAAIEAGEIIEDAQAVAVAVAVEPEPVRTAQVLPMQVLPMQVEMTLQTADQTNLSSLLTALADLLAPTSRSLETPPPVVASTTLVARPIQPAAAAQSDQLTIRLDRLTDDVLASDPGAGDALRRALGSGSDTSAPTHPLAWIPTRVVLPMAAVTGAITLAMAWIG